MSSCPNKVNLKTVLNKKGKKVTHVPLIINGEKIELSFLHFYALQTVFLFMEQKQIDTMDFLHCLFYEDVQKELQRILKKISLQENDEKNKIAYLQSVFQTLSRTEYEIL